MRRKRRIFIIIVVLILVAILGGGGYYGYRVYSNTLVEQHNTIVSQKEEIDLLYDDLAYYEGLFSTAYCVVGNLQPGEVLTKDNIEQRSVSTSALPVDSILTEEDILGKIIKIACEDGTVITDSVVTDELLSADERELDIVLDEIPIGLQEGDYVDVRISFPLGQDYIALSHKKVIAIYSGVVKLVVNQKDIYTYESMKTDAAIYMATKLYCVKYVEPGLQTAAFTYYPVSLEIMETMIRDNNIDTADFTEVLETRLVLETQLNESERVETRRSVTSDKSNLISNFKSAQTEYERLQERKAAQQQNQ